MVLLRKRFQNQKENFLIYLIGYFVRINWLILKASQEGIPKKLMVITGSPAYSETYFKEKFFKTQNTKIDSDLISVLFISEHIQRHMEIRLVKKVHMEYFKGILKKK